VTLFDLLPCSLWRITLSSQSVCDISLIWIGHITSPIYDLYCSSIILKLLYACGRWQHQ
jgi:hypothetical protein